MSVINALLSNRGIFLLGRVLLTLPFWLSGIVKLTDFAGAAAEMRHFGLEPAAGYAVTTIITQLAGSALVISGRAAWLDAGALIVFTLLTIPIAHDFRNDSGEKALMEMFFVVEHMGIVGSMILAAVLCRGKQAPA